MDISSFVSSCIEFIRGMEIKSPAKDLKYSVVVPPANYSPWLSDELFIATYASIKSNTLVDIYRCFELWRLVEQCGTLDGDILEVGVWRGGTGCLMAMKAKMMGSRARVFLADTFSGVVKAGENDPGYRGGEHADTSIEIVVKAKESLGLDNVHFLVGMFPEDTAEHIGEARISLCHIDVDVYESARDVLDWVWPKLVPGGVVIFDDYGCVATAGVTRLVNERYAMSGGLTVHNLNGHAVMVKIAS